MRPPVQREKTVEEDRDELLIAVVELIIGPRAGKEALTPPTPMAIA